MAGRVKLLHTVNHTLLANTQFLARYFSDMFFDSVIEMDHINCQIYAFWSKMSHSFLDSCDFHKQVKIFKSLTRLVKRRLKKGLVCVIVIHDTVKTVVIF